MHTLCNYSSSLPCHVKACCLAFYMRPYTYLSFTLHDLASVWRSTLSSLLSLSLFASVFIPSTLLLFTRSLDSPLFHPVLCLLLSLSLSLSLCLLWVFVYLSFSFSISLTHTRRVSVFVARSTAFSRSRFPSATTYQ